MLQINRILPDAKLVIFRRRFNIGDRGFHHPQAVELPGDYRYTIISKMVHAYNPKHLKI
jgi:hypothetical protein